MTPPSPGKSTAAAQFDPRSLYSSASPSTAHAKSPAAASASNSKREPSSSAAGDDADSSPGATSSGKKKPSKRRKVNLACIYCRRSHMTCDEGRPCQRCIKRDIGHLCHDEATPAKAHTDVKEEGGSPSKVKEKVKAESPATTPPVPSARLGASGDANAATNSSNVFGGGSAGPYSSISGLNQSNNSNNNAAGFDASNIFKPQAMGVEDAGPTSSGSSANGGISAAGMLSLASLFQNSINNSSDANANTNTNQAPSAQAVNAGNNQQQSGEMSGLGGAGWLGLGGGPGGYEGGGSGFGGDSAGGNEFTLLSEFLESLDGPGFGAGATPGMTGTSATMAGTGSGSGFTPSQSRRNTISGLGGGTFDGLTALTPIHNNADSTSRTSLPALSPTTGANTVYNSGSSTAAAGNSTFGSGNINNNTSSSENGTGKRSRGSSLSAAPSNSNTGVASGSYLPSLQGGSSKTERFFLTAADQKDGTRDERLARVIQAKYEAGLLRPYNHVNGYARLNRWMERNVSTASKRRILKPLSVFRPAFRAVAQSLTNIDLVFIEEAFERLLLDYDRVFSTQGIPACLWRRTGEIYKGNKEFAELVGVPIESLREGRLCIYELMAEESAVNYWEKYGAVSFDPGQKAVLTSCVLRTKNKSIVATSGASKARDSIQAQLPRSATASGQITPREEAKEDEGKVAAGTGATSTSGVLKDPNNPKAAFIHCCFSFTIRRDQWNIPHMIVGNFLPTNPP
uniref:Zn(2)-C6 fungal-type domain-containing protein n=1 Tax=Kalmanozyma brasiliensis (strain GHG001) TaxID=1365824 RepID=V5EIM2_KALBG